MEASEEPSERARSESKSPKAGVIDATAGSDYANTLQSSRTSQQASRSPLRASDIMMSSGLLASSVTDAVAHPSLFPVGHATVSSSKHVKPTCVT